jgi:hypothetical protein
MAQKDLMSVKWIMLIYKMPRAKTTAFKVATWRKLKRLGVYSVQDSVCILPYSERTLESLEWTAAEVREMGGDASVWEVEVLTPSHEKEMKDFFLNQVNVEYRELIKKAAIARTEKQLKDLWTEYHRVRGQDYIKSPLAIEARAACKRRAMELRNEEDDH